MQAFWAFGGPGFRGLRFRFSALGFGGWVGLLNPKPRRFGFKDVRSRFVRDESAGYGCRNHLDCR